MHGMGEAPPTDYDFLLLIKSLPGGVDAFITSLEGILIDMGIAGGGEVGAEERRFTQGGVSNEKNELR